MDIDSCGGGFRLHNFIFWKVDIMIILHCLKETTWNKFKGKPNYGDEYIAHEGFIHCSDISTFRKVAPNFVEISEPLVLLCIDTSRVNAQIKWEDGDNCGTAYPHIYGLLNLDSVVNVLPFLKDKNNCFVLNSELASAINNI